MRHGIAQKESRGFCFYHNPSPPPSVNVGESGTGFWQHESDQHWVGGGERGHFSLKSGKMCHHFFHDCRPLLTSSRCMFYAVFSSFTRLIKLFLAYFQTIFVYRTTYTCIAQSGLLQTAVSCGKLYMSNGRYIPKLIVSTLKSDFSSVHLTASPNWYLGKFEPLLGMNLC